MHRHLRRAQRGNLLDGRLLRLLVALARRPQAARSCAKARAAAPVVRCSSARRPPPPCRPARARSCSPSSTASVSAPSAPATPSAWQRPRTSTRSPPIRAPASAPAAATSASERASPAEAESGHHNLGAGRIASSDRARIDLWNRRSHLPRDRGHGRGAAHRQAPLQRALAPHRCFSDGGVHSSLLHLQAIVGATHLEEVPVVVHAILDGRDAPERSAARYLTEIEHALDAGKKGVIGTLMGRSYAMDRGGNWDRVGLASRPSCAGSRRAPTPRRGPRGRLPARQARTTIEPIRVGEYSGMKGHAVCDFSGGDHAPGAGSARRAPWCGACAASRCASSWPCCTGATYPPRWAGAHAHRSRQGGVRLHQGRVRHPHRAGPAAPRGLPRDLRRGDAGRAARGRRPHPAPLR